MSHIELQKPSTRKLLRRWNMPRTRWRAAGAPPGPRWGSSRRSPRRPSRLGRGTPPPQEHRPPRRLRRLDPRAFGARCRGTFGASFLAYTHLYF